MENKPGFKMKFDGEKLLYIIICILIALFIMFLPKIYKFVSDVKTGNAFKGTQFQKTEKEENKKEEKEEEKVVEPTGDTELTCTKTDSKAEGNLVETYIFYYTNDALVSLKQERQYDAITDAYLNYVYAEQAKYSSLYNLYKDVPGFSYTANLETRALTATFIYDFTKLNVELLKNADESLSITLDVKKGDSLENINSLYTNLGYVCK